MKFGKTGPTDVLRKGKIACETRGKREGGCEGEGMAGNTI